MNILDDRTINFIKKHHVLTLATTVNNHPYCANCFYVFLKEENTLVFTSDRDTKHIQDALKNSLVAGSIVLETKIIGKIQGIQFNGYLLQLQGSLLVKAKKRYLKRFPYARLMETTLWGIQITFVKHTDNRLGFGKKLIWNSS